MARKLLIHVRGNVVAYLALFVALGGTGAWAATTIRSKNIAPNAVLSKHIKNGEVRAADVRGDSLTGKQINEGTLGTVPSAGHANSADGAAKASTADSATNAQTAATANSVAAGSIDSGAVSDNSLTGADINEGSLVGVGGVLMGRGKGFAPFGDQYAAPSGESTATPSFGNVQMITPPVPLTVSNLRALPSAAPDTAGTSITVEVFKNGLQTGLKCTISFGETACNDTQHSFVTTGGEALSIHVTNTVGSSFDLSSGMSVRG